MGIIAAKALVRLAVRIRRMRMTTNIGDRRQKKENGRINDISSLSILDVDFKENIDQINTEHDSLMKWTEEMERFLLFQMARIAGSGLGLTYVDKENIGERWNTMRAFGRGGNSDVRASHSAASLLVSTCGKLKERGYEEEKGGTEKEKKGDREEGSLHEHNRHGDKGVWLPIPNNLNHSLNIYENSNTQWNINTTANMSSVVDELWPALVLLSKPFTMRPQRDHNFLRPISPERSPFKIALEEKMLQEELAKNNLSEGAGEDSPTKKAYLKSSWKGTVKGSPSPPRDYSKNPSTGSPGRTGGTSPILSPVGSPHVRPASRSLETTPEKQGKGQEDFERKTWIEDWKREKEEKKKMITAMNLLTGEPLLKPHQTVAVTTRIAPSSSYSFVHSDTEYGRDKREMEGHGWGLKEEERHAFGDKDQYIAVKENGISNEVNKIGVFDFSPTIPLKFNSPNNSTNNSAETTLTTSESIFIPSFSPSDTSSTPPPLSSSSEPVFKSSWLTLNDEIRPTSESVTTVLTSVKIDEEKSGESDILDVFDFTTVYSQKEEKRNILLPPSERESLRKIDIRKKSQLESNKSYPLPLFDRTDSTVAEDIFGSVKSAKSENNGIFTEESFRTSTVNTFNKQEVEFTPSISTAPFAAVATAADLDLLFHDKKAIINPPESPLSKSLRSPPPLPLQPGVKTKGGMGILGLKPPPTATTTVRRAPSQSLRLQSPISNSGFGDDISSSKSNDGGSVDIFGDGIRSPSSSETPTPSSTSSFPFSFNSTSTSSFSPSLPAANQLLSQTLPLPAKQNVSSLTATSVPVGVVMGTGSGVGMAGFTPSISGSFVPSSTKTFSPSIPKTDPFATTFSTSKSDPFAATTSDPFSTSSTFSGDPFSPSTSTTFPSMPLPLPPLPVTTPAAALSYHKSPTLANTYPEVLYPTPHGAYNNPMFNTGGSVPLPSSIPFPASVPFALSPAQYHQQTQMQMQMQFPGTYIPSTQYNSQPSFAPSPPLNLNSNPHSFPPTMNIYSQGQGQPQRSEFIYGVNPAVQAPQATGGQWQQQSEYSLPQTSLHSSNEKQTVVVNPFDEFLRK